MDVVRRKGDGCKTDEITLPSPFPSPLRGEGKGEGKLNKEVGVGEIHKIGLSVVSKRKFEALP
jgi:hypothetical protein